MDGWVSEWEELGIRLNTLRGDLEKVSLYLFDHPGSYIMKYSGVCLFGK